MVPSLTGNRVKIVNGGEVEVRAAAETDISVEVEVAAETDTTIIAVEAGMCIMEAEEVETDITKTENIDVADPEAETMGLADPKAGTIEGSISNTEAPCTEAL